MMIKWQVAEQWVTTNFGDLSEEFLEVSTIRITLIKISSK